MSRIQKVSAAIPPMSRERQKEQINTVKQTQEAVGDHVPLHPPSLFVGFTQDCSLVSWCRLVNGGKKFGKYAQMN